MKFVNCKECGAEVPNKIGEQVKHFIQNHPLQAGRALFHVARNDDPFKLGQQLGDYARDQILGARPHSVTCLGAIGIPCPSQCGCWCHAKPAEQQPLPETEKPQ